MSTGVDVRWNVDVEVLERGVRSCRGRVVRITIDRVRIAGSRVGGSRRLYLSSRENTFQFSHNDVDVSRDANGVRIIYESKGLIKLFIKNRVDSISKVTFLIEFRNVVDVYEVSRNAQVVSMIFSKGDGIDHED